MRNPDPVDLIHAYISELPALVAIIAFIGTIAVWAGVLEGRI